jgi:hypothetical protein
MKFGEIDDLFIYHHPLTNKHLGLARVLFANIKAAKECVERLHRSSVMGKILNVFLDAFGMSFIIFEVFCAVYMLSCMRTTNNYFPSFLFMQ